jgi:prepilin-type N-terminal cleavage/methylation domain-containing protein
MEGNATPGKGAPRAQGGFTLVEVLIVISIIAVLAGLAVVGIQIAKVKANIAVTTTTVRQLSTALDQFESDESLLPGIELEPDAERNDFPLLFEALFGQKRPKGGGGRNAPYVTLREDLVRVYDRDTGEYRKPTREERFDKDVPKFLLDAFGEPFVYRCNKDKDRSQFKYMIGEKFDIYSRGPDNTDQTMLGEEGDDIGSW